LAAPPRPQQDEAALTATTQQPQAYVEPADRSHVIYVCNFDLDLPGGREVRTALASPIASAPNAETEARPSARSDGKAEAKREETPTERANRFIDFVSNALVKELERGGYIARRLRPGDQRPEQGIRISGVFAEPDDQNRWRRAMIGSQNVGPMALFVSIGNLAKPDQALYADVDPKTASPTIGPIITVSAYAPVARFPMPKSSTEKAIRDTAGSIVADLTMLLRTNVAIMAH